MNRFHVNLTVADLEQSVRFYSTLFNGEPAVLMRPSVTESPRGMMRTGSAAAEGIASAAAATVRTMRAARAPVVNRERRAGGAERGTGDVIASRNLRAQIYSSQS